MHVNLFVKACTCRGRRFIGSAITSKWPLSYALGSAFERNSKPFARTRSHATATGRNVSDRSPLDDNIHVSLETNRPKRIVVGITGATGAVYAIRILAILRQLGIETHLVISKWALATLKYETSISEAKLRGLATRSYTAKDLSAPVASGSFQHDGMMIVPCSMKTLAAVRSGYCDDLISRAADVTLKEDRRLLLAVRETPLSVVHLQNLLFLRQANAIIFPPVPAFYTRPESIEDMVNQSVGRMLDLMGIHTDGFERWDGFRRT
ncbi:3-octaprenyl-4-hydroxybenzoate carboxy-lyase UbiX [Fusarium oxysporum f. sp. conglutinans race 2 54008]|uniref:Flavin prenyltransferase PAD1, mitochondrial n=1 Tax=Fusarium oxysporum f. sp. conglutinans race 2 54008 TaxID=1089457 RepID=X0GSL8_FUSOX|nr:3-octaprenyl-4-hydroxybenzoate carboxy-lyase UbiX [Fusarium oxysporum f. sp. conglutinans race 2 54008]KAG6989621.1 Flavin prenyltransferase PAD1 [Fusarium oxysporum f. sp. conglutinans]